MKVCMYRSAILLSITAAALSGQYTPAVAEWNRPVEPFRIAGNLYYVGAADVSAYLFATPQGHILLDTGFRETVPQIEANLKKLGFRMEDVRLLLSSHAHYDHVGGLAEVRGRTKARFLAAPAEVELFSRGGKGDFAFGDRFPFPPVTADAALTDGVEVELGGTRLRPLFTPGHTKGCTSWTTTVNEGGRTLRVVIACSLSAPGYQLAGNTKYPNIVEDFRGSAARLRALPCDIFLGFHSWDFDLRRKRRAGAGAFVDPGGLKRFADRAEAALNKQLGTR
jgi:metallo-beta-lactamase class B